MGRDVAALIVAAGQGVRFGACLPAGREHQRKQYLHLRRHPLVWWSLKAFERSPSIGLIVMAVPSSDLAWMTGALRVWRISKRVVLVAGGATRADSVRRGLMAVPPFYSCVAVHDGVRPLVTPALIEQVIRQARQCGAAIAAIPCRDTVKLAGRRQRIRSTPPREDVWLAQTPQVFKRALLERAHQEWRGAATPTDDAQMAERLGASVRLVEASSENIKVTVPADLMLAELIMKRRREVS